jgi:hypothetical protein
MFLFFPSTAHAIILLPAVVLIPIAKIIAVVIGWFSVSSLSFGVIWSKHYKTKLSRVLLVIGISIIIISILVALFLRWQNPQRPWI